MNNLIYFHNPRCSKSRQGLELLESANQNFIIRYYLKDALDPKEIEQILTSLKQSLPIRKKENIYTELDLSAQEQTLKQWSKTICQNPILLERPILWNGRKAIIGRPPEKITELFQ